MYEVLLTREAMRNFVSTLLVVTTLLLANSGRAATVTTTADDGPGSLRDAIANAAPGETVDFSVSGTITLTSGELAIDKNLIISGPGASNLVIQRSTDTGTPNFRIFNVGSGNVLISGVTVSNGRDDNGGGIYASGDLTLNDCVVSGNVATESGGGIFNTTTMTISNCVVRGNSASGQTWDGFGGGIYSWGSLTTIDSTINNNSVTSGAGGAFGGGICNDGTLTLDHSVVKDNSATGWQGGGGGFGGGIDNGFGTMDVGESTVSGNVARGGPGGTGLGEGGGLANGFGTVTLDRSTVSGNYAMGGDAGGPGEGGGIANDYGTVYVDNSTVSGNVSNGGVGNAGGGIFNDSGSTLLTCSTIASNVVSGGFPEDGGGIFNVWGSIEFKSTIVAANAATVDFFNGEFGYVVSDGFNLIGSASGPFTPELGDQFVISAAALKLGPLQDNGGPTFTHALLCGSPAIDAGDNTDAPVSDQRGFTRIVGGTIDIGAYEAGNTAPTITCPGPITLTCAPPGGAAATVSVNVADFDGDPLVVVWTVDGTAYQTNAVAAGGPLTVDQVDFTTVFGVGSHQVTVSVSDPSGCFMICSTTVDVGAYVVPVVNCPTVPSASADGNCLAAVPNVLSGVTVSGGCANAGEITLSQSPVEGTMVGLGAHTITVTATDAAGNSATCTTSFTVTDNTPPTVSCPAPTSASADANCQATVPNVLSGVTVSDTCSATNAITLSQSPAAGTMVGLGAHTVTVTATDAAGNSATCDTTFTVTDNTPPTVSCPSPTSASADASCQAAVPNVLSGVTASDNCSGTNAITLSQSPAAGTMVGLGEHTITVTATDAAGNSATCTTSFTVTDNTPPTVSCPAPTSASADGNCQAAVPNVLSGVTVSDSCSATNAITLSQSPAAGTMVGLGVHTITVTATDAAGNSATCNTTFTVTGSATLTINCPVPTSATANANCQAAVPNVLSGVTASGGCAGAGTITLSQSPAAGTLVGVGTYTITVTATDATGNSATCTTTFTVTGQAAIQIVTLTLNTDNDSPTGPHLEAGTNVNWTYLVSNAGCEVLNNVTVTDSVAGVTPTYVSGDVNLNGQLDPGETWTYTATGIARLCQYENIGTATGRGIVSNNTVTSSNPDHYFGDPTPCPAGRFTYTMDAATGDLKISFYQVPAPNDNSYGANAVGWPMPRGHTFKDLVLSDHAGFQLRNPSGVVKLDFYSDYLTEASGTPSGYKCLGPFGGDGAILVGTLTTNDIEFDTSLARNLNNLGYFVNGVQTAATLTGPNSADLLLDSPPTMDTYRDYTLKTPNPWTSGWDFQNSYFVTIKKAKLDSLGFNIATWHVEPDLAGLHNSPSKPCPTGGGCSGLAQVTPATGGEAISADSAVTGAFATLTGPVYTEDAAGQVGLGTIILNAPAGFIFDTGSTPPTVSSVKTGGGAGNSPVQGSVTSVTTTQITYTVTAISGNQSVLTWQNVRVRPTAGTPLASGQLTRSGTAVVTGLPTNAQMGGLTEAAGAAAGLVIYAQPSATAMAGVPFEQQPIVQVQDQFGNVRSLVNGVVDTTVVTAARLAGSGTLHGTTSMTAVDGIVIFTNLSHNIATNITIQFSSPGVTPVTSDPIAVSEGMATRLAFTTQPGNGAAGSTLGTQPVVRTQDEFGNNSTAGLPASLPLTVSLSSGTGPLHGTTTLDIGTAAGNGAVAFTNLRIDTVGTGKQLAASASGLTSAVSAAFAVTPGPAASLVIQTQPPTTVTAGATFSPAPVIRILDAYGNVVTTDSSTVITATRSLGTASLQGTTSATAVNGVATFSNLSYNKAETITIAFASGSLTGATSASVTVNPGTASKLTIQTQASPSATAGVPFTQQPVVRVEDSAGNLMTTDNGRVITVARSAGTGTLQGTLTATTVNGVATFANLSHNLANTITLNFTASGLSSATSANVVVSPAAFAKLQLLVPGETAAPGTASGKTGTPTSTVAGNAFNVTVNAVDAFWNLVNTVTDTVGITSSDIGADLPANAALVSGTRTLSVTLKAAGSQTLTGSDLSDPAKIANTSPSITVNTGAFVKLQLLVPGETAAPGTATGKTGTPTAQNAGTAFSVTVNAVDANWNLVTSANGSAYTIRITSSDANATLPSTADLSSGTRTFNVTLKTAGSATVTASDVDDATKIASTSPSIPVDPGAFTKLQILVPGETAAPGSSTGKTGTPTAQTAGTPFSVTVNAVDANWNTVTTVTDMMGITSSDANAALPANAALVAGTQTFSVNLKTAGSRTVTASDASDTSKTANTSPSLTVNAGVFVKMQLLVPGETAAPGSATGKIGTPSAQIAGTAFNVTANAVDANWNVVNTVTHTVGITSSDSNATLPANAALSAGTKTFSVTLKTVGSPTMTATDITDGTKTANTSPAVTVIPGAANKLTIQTQPSSTATAGVSFAQQPVIRVEDASGNLVTSDNGRVITVARSAGTGTVQGTVTATTVNGIATFTDLSHNVANTITLNFTASGLTGATSDNVVVSPADFAKLQLLVPGETAAPGTSSGMTGTPTAATAGTAVNVTVRAVDAFWNLINAVSDTVDIASSDVNATLPADTALVSGTQTLSVTFKTAGSQTLTASDVSDPTKTASTSPSITVNAGAFVKLQLLVPGETAASGTATGKTGTPSAQGAGTAFDVTVNAVDANWNLVTSANGSAYTIRITSSDANATLPSNGDLSSGDRTFSVTLKTAGSATLTASDVDDATKTASTSPSIAVNVGTFTKLQILVPGETAAPGSSTGKTGTPSAQSAGRPFNVTVNAVDANWNTITTVTDTVGITSSDANAALPADSALVAGTQTFSVTMKTAGSRTVTASDVSDGSNTANTSPSVTVNVGTFVKMQLLVPGEIAAPGSATGKTGTPNTQVAGTAFNVTANAVDANWNIVSSTHTVGITSSDSNAILPANAALSAGTKTFSVTLKTVGSPTMTATDITDGTKTANTSPAVTVIPGAANKLTIQTQPSSTATAGVPFAQQPVIRVEDASGNLITTDNGRVITVARGAGTGSLQGTVTATTVNGVATFTDLSHNVANTITLNFTASGLTGATSANVVVSPAAFAKLQLLVPGESAAPGNATGKTGTPTSRTAGTAFNVTVNAVDAFWNTVNTITDTVGITSSDDNAVLPADVALASGTQTLSVTLKTAGSQTLTASDLTDGTKTASTSPSITVNAGAFVKLQLLVPSSAALSAGTKTFAVTFKSAGSWTVTATDSTDGTKTANTSPSIAVNVGTFTKLQILVPGETAAPGTSTGKTGTPTAQTAGTPFNIIVNAVDANWNTVSTVTDTVGITSSDANAALPADAALVAGTQTFSVTLKTAGSRTVTASDLTDGSKTANTSPSLTVTTGAFVKMQLLVPGETAAPGSATGKTGTPNTQVAGTAFNVTANAVDANWNIVSSTHTVGITSSDANAVLPANAALSAGTKTFSVTLKTVGSPTMTATDITDGTKTANSSPAVTVIPGAANKLTIQTQPSATATAGVPLAQQPVVRVEDASGNLVTSDNGRVITVARSAGTGSLQGTLTATTVNGIATFSDLSHNVANTITLNFTASGLTGATSDNVVVSPAAYAKLQLLVPGETAAPGTASGKTGTPTSTVAGNAFNVTVNAVDAFWNLVNTITDTVDMTSSDANAALPADTALVSGTRTLSVTFKTAGLQTLTASDVTDPSKTANTSPSITVNTGAFVKLQLLVPGETAAPGTASGKTGTPSAQAAGTALTVTVNAVDANWNLVSSSHTVAITTTDPNDTHPSSASMSSGTRTFAVTFKSAASWTITATDSTDGTKSANTSPSITVNAGAFTKLQILVPGETAAPGSSTGKTGAPTAQTAGTPINATLNAVDANWNTVTTATDTVGITSSDANAALPANAALVAGTQTFSVTMKTVGSRTVTATDLTDSSKTANTSPSITVSAGAFVKLQLLVPGETAAPGSATGKSGTPAAQTSGTAFNVTANAVDANWNLVSSTHTVGITSSDSNATLPANAALSAGTRTASVTLKTTGSQTVTASDITDGTKTANTSPAITVNAGAASKLTIQTQPSPTATAGQVFAQQPVIRVEDSSGNLIATDNGRVITVARSAGTGTLQGTVPATTVNGIATFANLSHNVATTTSSLGLPASLNVSLSLTGGSGSLLGTTTLDIGTAAGNGSAAFATVECSDAGANKQITASAAGFADATSSLFTLDGVERATGGTAILSSTAGGTYTTLTGPVYYEYASGDVATGTIILNAPAGFIFDTGGTAPTVRVDRLAGGGLNDRNINKLASGTAAAIASRSTTQITFTVTTASSSGVTCSLTWQNIRVRPAAASPLASGNITKTGTSTMVVVTNSSTSFGRLIEIGSAARLAIQTQPSSTATAGATFTQQPVIRIEDAAGNLLTANNTAVVTATRSSGSGTLQGTTSRTAVNGLVTFTDLAHNVANNITISFSSTGLTGTNSAAIAVSPAAASQLVLTTQPANGTVGAILATQPVLRSRDQFGNDSTVGLGASQNVTVSLSSGTGPLMGTTTLDIGTSAGNGLISFADLRIDSAGTDKQLTASATGMSSATSSVFTVAKANQTITFGALAGKTYGDAPFTVGATASSGLPVSFSIVSGPAMVSGNTVTLLGAGAVAVRASQSGDANWNAATSVDQSFVVAKLTVAGNITANNKVYDGTTSASIATRTLAGVVGGDDVSLSGGTAVFADKNVGTGKAVSATGLSLSGTAAGNYQLASTSASTTADITAATLTGSITANNKTYDGTTTATIATRTLSGVVGSEAVSLVGGTATFANKTVGNGKSVTATGLSLGGADAGNYQLASTSAATTADITTRTLMVSATGVNKVYDGTTAATVTLSDNRVSGDDLTASNTTAEFADKNVGTGKTVSVSGISVTGADVGNYTVNTTATTAADITARTLTVSATGVNKVYDGSAAATVTLMDDRITEDELTASYTTASFADADVGNGKAVSVSGISVTGNDAGNYTVNTEASTVADITGATLTVIGITAENKVYDGTTVATLHLDGATVVGVVSGDDVTVDASVVAGAFSDAEVGTNKLVTVSGLTLIGADAAHYTLTQPTTTADITAAP